MSRSTAQPEHPPKVTDLLIRQKCESMIKYGYVALRQLPKFERHVLAAELRTSMWALLRLIVVCNKRHHKKTTLQDLDAELDLLRCQVRWGNRRLWRSPHHLGRRPQLPVHEHGRRVMPPKQPSQPGGEYTLPAGTCAADARGALWCASSVAAERLPPWSKRRAGRYGGVRFKRIALDRARWDLVDCPADPAQACARAAQAEGAPYDWRLILGYVAWLVPGQSARWTCNEFCAWCIGLADPWRFDCNALAAAVALAAQTTHERKPAS